MSNLRPITFATTFRAHVIPRLKGMVEAEAFFVALGSTDFGTASDAIMAEAMRLGAASLPDDIFAELQDWIGKKLLPAILAAEARIEAIRAEMKADPATFFASVATPRTKPIFEAVSPAYRRRLQQERRRG